MYFYLELNQSYIKMISEENLLQLLNQSEDYILRGRLKQSLKVQEKVALFLQEDYLKDKIKLQSESYNYMLYYFQQGTEDAQRGQLFEELRLNLLSINDQLKWFTYAQKNYEPFDVYLEHFWGAAIEFPKDYKDIEQLQNFFINLWLYPELTDEDYEKLSKFFKSDAHWVVKAMAISALTLTLLSRFDEKRIILLFDEIHRQQYQIWERAFIGLMFVLYLYDNRLHLYKEVINRLKVLPEIDGYFEKIKAVLIQIIRAAKETEVIQERFEKEIASELNKIGPEIERKLRNIEDLLAEDMQDDDENPDWAKIFKAEEDFFKKMNEFSMLQLEGADIMHSAFSKMKFFDFFWELPNWFLPFYQENERIKEFLNYNTFSDKETEQFLAMLEKMPFICNSDKYSFVYQLSLWPKEQVKVVLNALKIDSQESAEALENDSLSDVLGKSRFVIIQYVQDLYRFFKVYSSLGVLPRIFNLPLDFHNKKFFEIIGSNELMREIGEFYFAKKFYDDAIDVFLKLIKKQKDGELYEKIGFAYQKKKDYAKALDFYMKAQLYEQKAKRWLIKKLAFTNMKVGNYQKAIEYYQQLLSDEPDNLKILVNIANCYMRLGQYQQALQNYFKVEYYSPGNPKVLRPIGWIEFKLGELEKAKNFYKKLIEISPKTVDYITLGHIHFALREFSEAVNIYKKAKEQYDELSDFEKDFFADKELLEKYGLDWLSINLMYESVI